MLDYLKELLKGTIKCLEKLNFNTGSKVHRALISLYATLIEQADSAVFLIDNDRAAGTDIILRSSVEAYVDLMNLANDEKYIGHVQANYHKEWLKLGRAGDPDNNPFLVALRGSETDDWFAWHKSELESLKDTPPLTVLERFQRAGLENEYRSIYNELCSESHNNLRALVDRHFLVDEDKNKVDLIIFAPAEKEALAFTLHTFITILDSANFIVHDYFKSDMKSEIADLRAKKTALDAEWTAS